MSLDEERHELHVGVKKPQDSSPSCIKKITQFINNSFQPCVDGDNTSDSRAISLALLIMCCTCGTPITLLFTIPAYIFADRVRHLIEFTCTCTMYMYLQYVHVLAFMH